MESGNFVRTKASLPVSEAENILGLTEQEQKVSNLLMECYQAFLDLGAEHPEENYEFGYAVHLIQGLLTLRVARRCYPGGWPTYKRKT